MPDSVVIGRLAHYGRIISFQCDRVEDAILNGVHTVRMFIEQPIPAKTFIAGEFVLFGTHPNPRLAATAVQKTILRLRASPSLLLIASDQAIAPSNVICRHSAACALLTVMRPQPVLLTITALTSPVPSRPSPPKCLKLGPQETENSMMLRGNPRRKAAVLSARRRST